MRAKASSAILLLIAATAVAQDPPAPPPGHDITQVEIAPLGGAIAVPLPQKMARRLRKYDIPELVGARQAIGPQLINGRLPRPLIDYSVHSGKLDQRLSLFEGGLVVMRMNGAGGPIRKKLILPGDAVTSYLKTAKSPDLHILRTSDMPMTLPERRAELRVYDYATEKPASRRSSPGEVAGRSTFFALTFDPIAALPKPLNDLSMPLSDLLRAMSEDREVTSSIAGYEPKVGDELIGDDRKTYRVRRLMSNGGMDLVELECVGQPTSIYVAKKDLYNYFIGARGGQ